MRFCLGATDGLRATMTSFDWASIARANDAGSRRMPRWSHNRFSVCENNGSGPNYVVSLLMKLNCL